MKCYFLMLFYSCSMTISYAENNFNNDKSQSYEDDSYFESDFLEGINKDNIDLSQFDNNQQLEGNYFVYIYINNDFMTAKKIIFKKESDNKLRPCFSADDLRSFGIKLKQFPALQREINHCINLAAIPDAKSDFNFKTQRLYLSIPQIALEKTPRGFIDLANIDNGINATFLNYSYSGSKNYSRKHQGTATANYANLRPGVNLGAWRLRNYSTWTHSDNNVNQWDTVYTYASRNINSIKSQLTLGDGVSPAMVFDTVPFRGIQLSTDDDMYPESLRGYAPTVRGIARSNAQLTIRQNGYIIYQTEVPAGAFEINDLYPTGSSGDLYVTIKETDGGEQHLVVPFASLPILQREGYLFYSATRGQYRSYDSHVDKTDFTQISLIYGLSHGVTAYGGLQYADHYNAQSFGFGKNLGDFGALSLDITYANASLNDNSSHQGQSYRFRYNKNLNAIGTNIALAGYRYSTDGYYSLSETLDSYRDTYYFPEIERKRNRAETTVSQNLGGSYGAISGSYINEDYWNSHRKTQSASFSYNNSWNAINYSANYTYNKNSDYFSSTDSGTRGKINHLLSLSINIPFNFFDSTAYININTTNNNRSSSSSNIGISASQLNNRLNWSMQQGLINENHQSTGNINASYKGQMGMASGGSSYSKDDYNFYYGVNGSLVAHSGGLVLGQQLGETAALIEIPETPNVSILNNAGVSTNQQGYALVPYVSPYHKNTLSIDVSALPDNTEIELTSRTVIPSRGALVKTHFNANLGYRAFMTLTMENGHPVPFGAQAVFADNNLIDSIVDDKGKVYLSGLSEQGEFDIQFNNQFLCHVKYDLTGLSDYLGLYKTAATCQ
ncbi:fimbria/pilus outer membrane usher protein [Providencia rustigianii]|uniref:fimbria/pilus outer membrane usher protein n=1 Tax=Providencia rustigianii TaxID=158850 RepID=UPI000F6F7C02|nr:Outer membrane usher protein fimD precursor [Providencia rustigianii]